MRKKSQVTESSGNVFEDLGFEDSRELAIKADLVAAIIKAIAARGFKNQSEAASRMGIDQGFDALLSQAMARRSP